MASSKQKLQALDKSIIKFEAMADLPTFEERKRALLRKCDEAYEVAQLGRNYVDKHGEEHSNPDSSGMTKCIELAARIMGVLVEAEKRARDGDGDSRVADLEEVARLMRLAGYTVAKAA